MKKCGTSKNNREPNLGKIFETFFCFCTLPCVFIWNQLGKLYSYPRQVPYQSQYSAAKSMIEASDAWAYKLNIGMQCVLSGENVMSVKNFKNFRDERCLHG